MTTKADNAPKKWEQWAKGKKPSMKRRSESHDYHERCIYMITMAIEGRKPLLGKAVGDPDATDEASKPHVVLSPLGEKVLECWHSIPLYYPKIKVLKLCIMPDHIHGILFVHERMEKHLGTAIDGFKTGTRKAAKELGLLPPSPSVLSSSSSSASSPSFASSASSPSSPSVPFTAPVAQSTQQRQPPSRHTAAARAHGLLWETGYNDRILTGKGQLERMNAYLDDNPRRLLIKRLHPEFFAQRHHFVLNGIAFEGIGNRFLLDNPTKIQVQCSRRLTPEDIEQQKKAVLEKARKGFVIVSPCISPGEQQRFSVNLGDK